MRLGKVDFPERLVDAVRNRELVVFAGAGVSMGQPAGLPGFRALAEKVAEKSGESELDIKKALDSDSISPDVYLGRLKGRGADVHVLAAEELSKPNIRHTELHRVLLSLCPGPDAVRVVTTNFDLLFEQAAKDAFPEAASTLPDTRRFPDFPSGSSFRGIVHLHGDVAHASNMVLTDKNFGVAYLGPDPEAQRFIIDLLSTNTLLFIGYSGGDVIFRYLARALSATESPRHFAMVRAKDEPVWLELGIQPILYPTLPSDPDGALCESLSRLAEHAGASIVEQRSRIEKLASKVPSELNREEADLVADALSDTVRLKFFTRAATSPEWIAWLDERKYLDALFCDEDLSAGDRSLAEWLAGKFVYAGAKELFALIGRHKSRLHTDFWGLLLWQVGVPTESLIDTSCLERWVSLLLSTVPPLDNRRSTLDLLHLAERCAACGLMDYVVDIFETLAASCLILERFPSQHRAVEESHPGVDAEFSPTAEQYELGELWRKWLQPQLPRVVRRLLPILVENLAKQYRTLCTWGKSDQHWDPTSFDRSAIEPHDQDRNRDPNAADVLIDAARDGLQWLAKHERDAALYWCGQLAGEKAPILRRLAVHTLTGLSDVSDFGPNEKIDRFLLWGVITDYAVHHEIFRAMQFVYPRASRRCRHAVIDAVLAFQMPSEKDPDGIIAAYEHFNWFHWLFRSDSNCGLAAKARDQVLAEHSEFCPREHPDFQVWTESEAEFVEPQSPWTADQLLAEPADRWIFRLHEYHPEEFSHEIGLYKQVTKAAQDNFEWGTDLAHALVAEGNWDSGVWRALLQAWATADEREILNRQVFQHLSREEMLSKHSKGIASLLYAWARSGQYAKLLGDADCVATKLWPVLLLGSERDLIRMGDGYDWLTTAINHPSGILAQFWFERTYANGLRGKCRTALSAVVRDLGIPGRLGRAILAGELRTLLQKDEEWARENLLPFFELHKNQNAEDCQAVWEGFLCRPYINDKIFGQMEKAFLSVAEQLQSDCCFLKARLRKKFLRVYARIVTVKRFVPDPLDKWLPSILQNCDVRDMEIFIAEIGLSLKGMSEEDQAESWHRWLKEYWRLRRHGAIAGYLTREETTGMFHWLPCLRGTVFSEAVALAEQTSPIPRLRHGFLFRELDEAGLCKEQPEAVARLLLCLDKAESPRYAWSEGGKLVRKLLALGIPAELQNKLEDLAVLRDISIAEESIA